MKSYVLFIMGLLVCSAEGKVEPLNPPTHGDWKGQEPGTWVVTRYTSRDLQTNRADRIYLYKSLLVGEDDGGVHLVGGECNINYEYTRTPYAAIHPRQPAWYGPVAKVETNKISLKDGDLSLFDEIAVTNTVENGKRLYTRRMLAERPDFMVAFRNEMSDEFRGESYHMTEEEIPVEVATKDRFDKKRTVYTLAYSRSLDGKQIVVGTVYRSPDLPMIESFQKTIDREGHPVSETHVEMIAMGVDAALLATVPPPIRGPRFTDKPDPDSSFYKANALLLKEQGFNDRHVQMLMPDMRNYDSMTNLYHHVQPAWTAYAGEQSVTNRKALIEALGWTYSTSHPVTEPQTEALLLKIAEVDDTGISVRALSMLAGFCAPRYMRRLEDYVIRHELTNAEVLQTITSYYYGNPSRVLKAFPFPLETLREYDLIYAPSTDAVTDLLRRRSQNEQSFSLEHLLGFDDDRVRCLVSELSSQPVSDEAHGKMRLVYLIQGLGIYDVPNAKEYLSKLIKDLSAPNTATNDHKSMALFRPMLLARTLQAALETYDPELRSKVVNLLKKDMGAVVMLAMTEKEEGGEELLFSLKPYLADADIKNMFSSTVKTPYGEFSMNSRLDQCAVLLDRRFFGDLDGVVARFLPFYEPGKNCAADALMYKKRWYMERKGIAQPPWAKDSGKQQKDLISKILPSYGEAGIKILLNLAQIEDFRAEALKGLARATGDRESLLTHVKKIGRPRDPLHEANPYDIAIWVLGDRSVAEDMEQRLKYPPNHVGSRPREYLPWLDRDYLLDIAKRRDKIGIINANLPWLVKALSKHRDREAWEMIWEIWEDTATPKNNIAYARLFNASAGRSFGLRKSEMKAWIKTLPHH